MRYQAVDLTAKTKMLQLVRMIKCLMCVYANIPWLQAAAQPLSSPGKREKRNENIKDNMITVQQAII